MEGGWPEGLDAEVGRAPGKAREAAWASAPRRRRRPPARLGPLRRQVLHARHDGHRPQPRPQRPVGRGPRQADRATSASPSTPTGVSSPCTAASCSASRARSSTRPSTRAKELAGTASDAELPPPSCCATSSRRYKQRRRAPHRARPSPRTPSSSSGAPSRPSSPRWNGPRAVAYRQRERIAHDLGTAVNVQAMVFGNRDDNSGTGVGFTRDPATGAKGAYGDFLVNAQGEDVVAGIRNTEPLAALETRVPHDPHRAAGHLRPARAPLPRHVRHRVHHRAGQALDAPDPGGQAHRPGRAAHGRRHGRRPGPSGSPTPRPLQRITERPPRRGAAPAVRRPPATRRARRASAPRRAPPSGRVYFTADDAAAAAERGEQVILVRSETSPEDVHGMLAAEGILTARGGLVSHAAVVARGWGKPAVVGAEALRIGAADNRSGSATSSCARATGSRSTAPTGTVVLGPGRRSPRPRRRRSSTTLLGWADDDPGGPPRRCGPTPTPATTPPTPASSGPRASGCAAPSTCSSATTACPSCAA